MADYKERVDALAGLMEEFRLTEASYEADGFRVAFKRRASKENRPVPSAEEDSVSASQEATPVPSRARPEPSLPAGTPVTSPMNGIFYGSPTPSAPPFVRVADTVSAGQIIGLIEAMKVFNEIPCPVSGTVIEVVAEGGSLVQPGDVLLYVG